MRRAGMLVALLASAAGAQVANGPAPDVLQRPEGRPSGGGIGIGISFNLGRKIPKPPPALAWDIADAAIADQVPGELVIVLGGSAADATRIARMSGVTLVEVTPLESIGKAMAVVALISGDTAEAATRRLNRQRGIDWIQPNFRFQSLGRKLPRRFSLIGISRPEQLRASGTVAMIDTPVDMASAELRGARISQTVYGTSAAPAAHGTAIASLLVGTGEVAGMAQGAQLISLAALDPDTAASGLSQTRYLAKAFDAAWKLRPDVLNLSFGGHEDPLLSRILAAIEKRGVCMAGAVGNGGPNSGVLFPARHPAVLAVTAVDEARRIYPRAAQGPQVATSGIGVALLAAVPGGYRQVCPAHPSPLPPFRVCCCI